MKYDVWIEFVPGKFLHIADTLSKTHSPLISETTDLDEEVVLMMHNTLHSNLFATPTKPKELREETDKNKYLQLVKNMS